MAHVVELRRVRRSAEQWRRMVAEWTGSGLSQSEFCRRRGLSLVTFGGWKRHFQGGLSAAARSRITPGGVISFAGTDQPVFVEVANGTPAAGTGLVTTVYEVGLAHGRSVRIGPEFDPATLRRLLAIVDAHGHGAGEARGC